MSARKGMSMRTMRKLFLSLAMTALGSVALAHASSTAAIFANTASAAPPGDVIAATVPEIVTTVNGSTVTHTVSQIPMPANVAPQSLSRLSNVPVPTGTAVGLVYAIKGDNLSQANPDCPAPSAPSAASCQYGGTNGTVYWSGFDQVTGGTCANGQLGGWLTTAASCNPPPAMLSNGSNSFTTGYGVSWTNNGNGTGTVCGMGGVSGCGTATVTTQNGNTIMTFNGVTQVISSGGSQITTYNQQGQLAASYNVNTGTAASTASTGGFFQSTNNTVSGYQSSANVNGTSFSNVANNTTTGAVLTNGGSSASAGAVITGGGAVGIGAP